MTQVSETLELADGQKEQARKFRKRLHGRDTFVMPEAWDVASARVLADAGFDLMGVSLDAIAWSQGVQSTERFSLDELLGVTARITKGFDVPVNASLEGVLGRTPEDIQDAVARALSIGCIGVTFGDGGRNGLHGAASIEHMTACIRAAKAAASEARIPAVITAGVEAFMLGSLGSLGTLGSLGHSPFEMTVERAEAYFEAGADCVLAPGVQHIQLLERLTAVVDGPIAITIGVTLAPDVKSFAKAGAAYVALGGSMMRSLLGVMRFKAEELHAFGQFTHFDRAIPARQLDAMMDPSK